MQGRCSMCDNFVVGCMKQAQDEYDECRSMEELLTACGIVSGSCVVLLPPLELLCSVAGIGCSVANYVKPDCGDILTGKISFCLSCWEMCMRNSYPDKKRTGNGPP